MKKFALMAAMAMAAVLAMPTAANAEWYAGAGYTHYDFDDVSVGGVTGRLGYKFSPHFAVEGEGTFGVADDDNAELNNAFGAYAVGILPVSDRFDVFGRVGYQQVDIDGTGPIADINEEGIGYGAGANWRISDRIAIRGEYTRLDGDAEADTVSLGGVMTF